MKRIFKVSFLMLLFFLGAMGGERRTMSLVDILNVPSLSSPGISPDGKRVVYLLRKSDWKENRRTGHIWVVDLEGGEQWQLTNGSGRESNPIWSPDGKMIAFRDKREGDDNFQIYLISIRGGEARRLSNHATSVSRLAWHPDGEFIYFLADDPLSKEKKEKKKLKDDVYAFEENYEQRHLWRINVKTGEEEKITDGDYTVYSFDISRDGKMIAFVKSRSPVREDLDRAEVWVMNQEGEEQRQLTYNSVPEYGIEISPDGRYVLFISWVNENFELYYDNNLFIVPTEGGPTRMVLKDFKYGIDAADWGKNSKDIYFLANMGVHREVFKVSLPDERYRQYTDGKHNIRGWDFLPEKGLHILSLDKPNNPGDLWLLSTGRKVRIRQITHVFDYLEQEFYLPEQKAIRWKGEDGVTVEGILFYPIDYQEGQRYPLAVFTHGGPRSSDKFGFGRWRLYIPVLTAKGYAVLLPNYRGSTGYGDEFVRDMVGHYYHQAHKDVIAGVQYLIEQGLADSTKLLTGGWSAGGHMTNKLITYTDIFKAASSGAGAVNWISMYGQSDTRIQRTPWFGGTPWQKNAPIDIYWEHSPLKYIWKVKTPTIIFVGENDPRVPMPQSVELYRALKYNGVPTKLYVAPREGHGWRELRHQLFKMNAELEWFEKYVMHREYTWEKAPVE